ncbi:MAG TPA: PAS domain S-box protein, partial [Blastocatellia bacterium]|nr:PAS domain S-box protein [Blastocatellia bacterium]
DKTNAELEHELAELTLTGQQTGNPTPAAPTAEELQTMLADLQADQPDNFLVFSALKAMEGLVHELHVHQVELEMQNRELREARQALEASHQRYVDLYDFAPNGYVTLDEQGVIREINLPGARLLGKERSYLIGKPFVVYVAKGESRQFREHLRRCQAGEESVTTELILKGESAKTVQVLSIPVHDEVQQRAVFRTALIDISERRRAEQSARASEARFAAILNSAMDAIITTDAEQRIVLFNEAAEEMFCCSAQAALGEPLTKFIPARYRQTHPQQVNTFGKTKITKRRMGESGVIFGLRANGEEFPMESSISQVEIEGRRFFTVIHRDITARLRRTEDLRKSEGLLAATQAMVHLGSYDYKIEPPEEVYWSEETFRILGVDPAQSAPPTRDDYFQRPVHPDDRQRVQTILEQTLTTAAPFNCEYRVVKPDGTVSEVVSVARPTLDAAGKVIRLVGTVMDITERKHTERRLIEQAAMLNQAQEAIMVRDLDDGIRFWNQGAERLYGWSAEEIIGRPVNNLLYHGDSSQLEEAMKTVVAKGEWVGELRQFAKDGRELMIEGHWTLIRDGQGKPKSILAINNDITEKKKLEAQFLRAQRLESIGTLASGIAHDLNNVLSPVLMAVQLLQMRLQDESSQRILDVLQQNVMRGSEMVKQVLSFARGTTGERVEIQPQYLLKEVIAILHETFPKNITVRYSVPPDLHSFSGDPTQIHQVLMNLCVNARDAMQANGGTLTIVAENKFVDEQLASMIPNAKRGQYVVITIGDTGTGITSEVLDKIFDPFFTTKEVGKGTGLGLSTVYSIIKSHGGFVTVYSEVGKGTKFYLYLPKFTAIQSSQPIAQVEDLPMGHGELILIVDDEKAIREITQGTLESFGYRVLTAADGTEALVLYAQHKDEIHLVLTDMMMPYLDGLALIRALLKINPSVQVIASSGLTETERTHEAEQLGVKTYLAKPYTAHELLQTLHQALQEQGENSRPRCA